MPLFEYKCYGCGHVFEKLHKDSNELVLCPDCKRICAIVPSVTAFRRDHTVLELSKK